MFEIDRDGPRLLGFPVSKGGLHAVSLGACGASFEHLFYLPMLLATFLTGVVMSGAPILLGAILFVGFMAVVVCWGHALGLLIHGVMKTRRGKEVLGFVTLTVFVLLSFAPVLMEAVSKKRGGDPEDVSLH